MNLELFNLLMSLPLRSSAIALLLILLTTAAHAQGGLIERRRARTDDQPPKALLIKINTQQNRMAYATRTHNQPIADQVQKDIMGAARKMIQDFTENFDYCPVYYFYDTSAYRIQNGDYAGALLDKDLQPVKNIVLQRGDTNFFVGYFGFLTPDTMVTTTEAEKPAGYDARPEYVNNQYGHTEEEPYRYHADLKAAGASWVVLDYRLRNVRYPIPYTYYPLPDAGNRKWKRSPREYRYTSKKYDIIYRPCAFKYNATLYSFYREKTLPSQGK